MYSKNLQYLACFLAVAVDLLYLFLCKGNVEFTLPLHLFYVLQAFALALLDGIAFPWVIWSAICSTLILIGYPVWGW